MDYRQKALAELATSTTNIEDKRVFAGFDGFVDTILHLVAQRTSPGDDFTRIDKIEDFGTRIVAASGKSTNIEMYPQMEKLGGNGPIFANAMVAAGFPVRYLGSLGKPHVHPIFEEFAARTNAISIAGAGLTNAIEFKDGKIMMGITKSLGDISFAAIIDAMGSRKALIDELESMSLVAFLNWTMIPHMTEIFRGFLKQILPDLSGKRSFFFDLADPEKRSTESLIEVLQVISEFETFGPTTLGLNFKEAQRVATALKLDTYSTEAESLKQLTVALRDTLSISTVVVHPTERAACATTEGSWCVEGPFTENPKVTTGAGDHFNSGFSAAQQLALSPEACLTVGTCFSGYYVRTAKSPSLEDIQDFLRDWK